MEREEQRRKDTKKEKARDRDAEKDRCRQMHLIDAESLLAQMSENF